MDLDSFVSLGFALVELERDSRFKVRKGMLLFRSDSLIVDVRPDNRVGSIGFDFSLVRFEPYQVWVRNEFS